MLHVHARMSLAIRGKIIESLQSNLCTLAVQHHLPISLEHESPRRIGKAAQAGVSPERRAQKTQEMSPFTEIAPIRHPQLGAVIQHQINLIQSCARSQNRLHEIETRMLAEKNLQPQNRVNGLEKTEMICTGMARESEGGI